MPELRRYKLVIAYRGTRYHGWQSQTSAEADQTGEAALAEKLPTIQDVLTRAIQSVVRHPVRIVGSSRTDAGVHAKGQLAHFETDQAQIPADGLRRAVNHVLPEDVLVRTLEPAADGFDALASTTSKRYQYLIWNAPDRPLFFPDLAWHRWQSLDDPAMCDAANRLVGQHDFASFTKPGHGRESTVRTILGCEVTRRGPRLVIGVEGTGFLWNMVRIIVGTLVECGLGRYPPSRIDEMLAARDRRSAGPTAPAHGLYLQWVKHR